MKFSELKAAIAQLNLHDDDEVWFQHPDYGMQWGPILGISKAVTDKFTRIALVHTYVEDEDYEKSPKEELDCPVPNFLNEISSQDVDPECVAMVDKEFWNLMDTKDGKDEG